MADGTERPGEPGAPDLSGPPSLRDAFKAFTTPGTDPDALMKALRDSQMPSVPLSQMAWAAQSGRGLRWCRRCGRPEPEFAPCPEEPPGEVPTPAFPADPFPEDMLAGMGIAQMLEAMEAGGVPPLRAERIIGAMLAAHGLMAKEEQGGAG